LYLTLSGTQATAQVHLVPPPVSPDELYRHRDDPDSAKQAIDIWAKRAATGADFEASWKLARGCYWLGTEGVESERRQSLQRGVRAGEQAITLDNNKPEGHFWTAANLGELAELSGKMQGLRMSGRVKSELERVIALQPGWQQGSAESALGRWYDTVPWIAGGSDKTAEMYYRKALGYNPQSRSTLSYLADLLIDHGHKIEAHRLLEQVISLPIDPDWAPEDRDLAALAALKLKKLDGGGREPLGLW
jgi:tetratricopeptide (TPR) repeat protein